MCVDYRSLNQLMKKIAYQIPLVDEVLGQTAGANIFSKTVLKIGYHQLLILKKDKSKTAFNTRYGQFQFKVLPFGLCNAPAKL